MEQINLNCEEERLKSFRMNNWCNLYINEKDLALVGFYYLEKPDLVKCNFCQVVLYNFENGDIALQEHIKWSPNCPLIKRRATGNIPIDYSLLDKILPAESFDEVDNQVKER